MSDKQQPRNHSDPQILCEFCNELQASNAFGAHLNYCGSKTEKCAKCNKYIRRAIFVYHQDNNCTNPFVNVNVGETTTTTTKFDNLQKKTVNVQDTLDATCYPLEKDYVKENLEFNIIIMGSPRVGKSELINAICEGNQAETSSSLNSCTAKVTKYTLTDRQQQNPNVPPFAVHFYDTPGIESWSDNAGETKMIEFITEVNPLCMIYCASPGSFSKLDQLHTVLEHCRTKHIFCALVCTNMWSGNRRRDVIEEFENQLAFFGPKISKQSPNGHGITFFGDGALCTMVNSKEYSDPGLLGDVVKPVQGIDELLHGIMESIDEEKLLGWCYAILYRRSYWQLLSHKVGGFFQLRFRDLASLIDGSYEKTSENFTKFFSKQSNKKN